MRFIKINQKSLKSTELKLIVDLLKKGKVLVLPTDTVYGFVCRSDMPSALARMGAIKGRDSSKRFINLAANLSMLKCFVSLTSVQEDFLLDIQKGRRATTIILPDKGVLPKELKGAYPGLPFRLPKSDLMVKILTMLGSPLASTSLNLSNQPLLLSVKNLDKYLPGPDLPDLVVDAGYYGKKKPSRLISLLDEDGPQIIRK